MKTSVFIAQLTYAIALLFCVACSKEEMQPFVLRDTDQLSFNYASSGKTFTVCTNGDWTVSNDGNDWITVDKESGTGDGKTREVVTANAARNTGGERSGRLVIHAAGKEIFIDIAQEDGAMVFGDPSLTVPLALDAPLEEAYITVPYTKGIVNEPIVVTATLTGPGASGISIPETTITLDEETGTFRIPLSGTPDTEGGISVTLNMLETSVELQANVIRTSNTDPVGTVYLEQRFDLLVLGGDHVGKAAGKNLVGAWAKLDGKNVLPENPVFEINGTPNTDGTGDYFNSMHPSYVTARGLTGWTGMRVYERPGYPKIGTAGSTDGFLATPALSEIAGAVDLKVTYKAARWSENASSDAGAKLIINILNAGTTAVSGTEISLTPTWENKEFIIRGATAETVIQFRGRAAANGRFMVDDIVVAKTAE